MCRNVAWVFILCIAFVGCLVVWPLSAFVTTMRLSNYCASTAASLNTVDLGLSEAQLTHLRSRLPSMGTLVVRFCGGIVFQVCSTALVVLAWWLPTTVVLSILSGHVDDVVEVQIGAWVAFVASVVVAWLVFEPMQRYCRYNAAREPCFAMGATGTVRVDDQGIIRAAPANAIGSFAAGLQNQRTMQAIVENFHSDSRRRGTGRVCCFCFRRRAARSQAELLDVLSDDSDDDSDDDYGATRRQQLGPNQQFTADAIERVETTRALPDDTLPAVSTHCQRRIVSGQRVTDADRYMAQLDNSERDLLIEVNSDEADTSTDDASDGQIAVRARRQLHASPSTARITGRKVEVLNTSFGNDVVERPQRRRQSASRAGLSPVRPDEAVDAESQNISAAAPASGADPWNTDSDSPAEAAVEDGTDSEENNIPPEHVRLSSTRSLAASYRRRVRAGEYDQFSFGHDADAAQEPSAVPEDHWREVMHHETGQPYWWNTLTNAVTWDPPTAAFDEHGDDEVPEGE